MSDKKTRERKAAPSEGLPLADANRSKAGRLKHVQTCVVGVVDMDVSPRSAKEILMEAAEQLSEDASCEEAMAAIREVKRRVLEQLDVQRVREIQAQPETPEEELISQEEMMRSLGITDADLDQIETRLIWAEETRKRSANA